MIVVTLFQVLGSALQSLFGLTVMQRLKSVIQIRLFNHIVSLPHHLFVRYQVGDYSTRLNENLKLLDMLFNQGMALVMDLSTATYYLFLHTKLTLIGLIFLFGMFLLVVLSSPKLRANDKRVFAAASRNESFVIQMVTGMLTVKSLAGEERFFQD